MNYKQAHYQANKARYLERARENTPRYRARNREYVLNHLLENPCVDCGETDPVVLDFDHVRGTKTKPVSRLVQDAVSVETLQREIDKCDVRCANCHRRVTAKRREGS